MADVAPYPVLFTVRLRPARWWLLLPIIGCLLIITGCILYLAHSHDYLSDWYLGLFPCIYKAWEWPMAFFTPSVKAAGNIYCIAGIVLAALLIVYFGRQWLKKTERPHYLFRCYRQDAWYLAGLYSFGLAIWLYGMLVSVPGYDEVFSAVNCAGIHPFQTASYYMLPNNHVFFNLLNAIAGAFTGDKLLSGRIISGLAFAGLIPLLYYWLKSKTVSRPYAALFCAIMLLQFPVWGFSFQGRGYSIYLLCAWTSFIFLQRYLQTGHKATLSIHAIAIVIGFWTIPSFLFWEAALIIYLLLNMLISRKLYWPAIQVKIIAGLSVFLVFLPVLVFSGKAAILENRYVHADKVPFMEYWHLFRSSAISTVQYTFSGFVDDHSIIYLVLFFLPLLLLPFIRKTRVAGSVAFYGIMWLIFCIIELYMQRYPFLRNLTAHCSMTLATLLLSCHALMRMLLKAKWQAVQLAVVSLCCIVLSIHFVRFSRDHIHDSLYFYNADTRYRTLHDAVMTLPEDAQVGLSDEGFYWEYLCHQRGLEASMCMNESATYYIKMDTEVLPVYLAGRVELWKKADEYEIYKVR